MIPVFDKVGSLDRVDGDADLLLELIDMAAADASVKIPLLESSCSAGNGKALSETAHSIKSAFGNVGAMQCHGLCYEIEKKGKQGIFDGVPELIASLREGVTGFLRAVDEFRKSRPV